MGLAPERPQRMCADDLQWEATQQAKHEFVQGEVLAMEGARQEHVLVT